MPWLMALALALPGLLFGFVAWHDRGAVLRQAEQRVHDVTAILEENARSVLQSHELVGALTEALVRNLDWDAISASGKLHDELRAIADHFPQVHSIWLADATGQIRSTSMLFPVEPFSIATRDYFRALSSRDEPLYIGQVVLGRVSNNANFNIARRRNRPDGTFDGVVVVSAWPSTLSNFWSQVVPDMASMSLLFRDDGAVLARSLEPDRQYAPLDPEGILMRQVAGDESGLFWGIPDGSSEPHIMAFHRIDGFPVVVAHGISVNQALAPWREHLVVYGLFFLLATAGFAVLTAIAVRRIRDRVVAERMAARFAGVLNAAPDPMMVVRQDLTITFANNQAGRVFGYAGGIPQGTRLDALITGESGAMEQLQRGRDFVWSEESPPLQGLELTGRRTNGSTFPADVTVSPVQLDGEALLIAQVRDTTERRRLEAAFENSRLQMMASARLSALGTMAGGIAHEINNPLAVIHAKSMDLVEDLEEDLLEPAQVMETARQIVQYTERIAGIIASMRRIARDGVSDPPAEVPVGDIVAYVMDVCRERFRDRGVGLTVTQPEPSPVLLCREVQVAQVLLNLLQNAFDAVQEQPGERQVRLEVVEADGMVRIAVTDNGPGVPDALRNRIMEPFFTTKPPGKGTGLGLSLSRGIADQHGGKLEYQDVAVGSRFVLTLPMFSNGSANARK